MSNSRIRSYTDNKFPIGYLGGNPLEEVNWDDNYQAIYYIKKQLNKIKDSNEYKEEYKMPLAPPPLRRQNAVCGICYKEEGFYKYGGTCKTCFKKRTIQEDELEYKENK